MHVALMQMQIYPIVAGGQRERFSRRRISKRYVKRRFRLFKLIKMYLEIDNI